MTAGTVARMKGPPPGVLDRAMFAAKLGIEPGSVTRYVNRREAPEPDGYVGLSPWWYEATVTKWIAERPGTGNRRSRQPKTK